MAWSHSVPEGRPIVARRFNAGFGPNQDSRPVGTAEMFPQAPEVLFSRAYGTGLALAYSPRH
jgi:hypothetical protein